MGMLGKHFSYVPLGWLVGYTDAFIWKTRLYLFVNGCCRLNFQVYVCDQNIATH
jgi:hypothetical protein